MNSLKRIMRCLRFNKKKNKKVENIIFEVPFDAHKTSDISVPNIQNKTFKISKWFVKVGNEIQEGQVICELESNSILVELETLYAGKLVQITQSKEKLKTNDFICKIQQH